MPRALRTAVVACVAIAAFAAQAEAQRAPPAPSATLVCPPREIRVHKCINHAKVLCVYRRLASCQLVQVGPCRYDPPGQKCGLQQKKK